MTRAIDLSLDAVRPAPRAGWIERIARRAMLSRLAGLRGGQIVIEHGTSTHRVGTLTGSDDPRARIRVRDGAFWGDVAFGGSVGAGGSYIEGRWTCDDLTALVRILAKNRAALERLDGGLARLVVPLLRRFHARNTNSRDGSRRNIAAHYDLGNDFFRLFLDETMSYSCAFFERDDTTLEEASVAKLDRVCRKLDLGPADHVVEIGTGWGGFALHAAGRYGCRVTTTTISAKQYEVATERVRAAGLEDRVELLLEDYRDLGGTYDKLVSIEMIEAVGHEFLDTYFRRCQELLRDDGSMLLQAITIADRHHDEALRNVDFIQRYVFPGSYIPSISSISASVARATDFSIVQLEDIGLHYARTLGEWRERFAASVDEVRALGYPDEFVRMWEFYLSYCEGGFAERAISDVHVLLQRPGCRASPALPESGA